MRPEVWGKFQDRFGVPRIAEFYASTEGNATLLNSENKFGAVGFVSPLVQTKYPVRICKFDVQSETLVRDARGRCVECGVDEPGELLGKVDQKDVTRRFDGYTDRKATEKKIVTGVLADDDVWFRTGDLLRRDKEGFVYFVDRIGDTFRWKGENISTNEVAECLSMVSGVLEANVYGAQIPTAGGQFLDGRAGMASLVIDGAHDESNDESTQGGLGHSEGKSGTVGAEVEKVLADVYTVTRENLAPYQVPLFVRVQAQMVITPTFKHKKVELVRDGIDPEKCGAAGDQVYLRDAQLGRYVPLTTKLYQAIVQGRVKL